MPYSGGAGILTVVSGSGLLVDTKAISSISTNGLTSLNFTISLNIGSGPNGTTHRALLVALFFTGATLGVSTSPAMTWNGTGMTLISGPFQDVTNIGDIYYFGMVAPATGANTLAASWTGANQVAAAALSVVGADQTGGTTTFHGSTSTFGTGGTTASITASSALAGELSLGAYLDADNFAGGQGNTDIGHLSGADFWAPAANYAAGASPTLTYSATVPTSWVSSACSIKAG